MRDTSRNSGLVSNAADAQSAAPVQTGQAGPTSMPAAKGHGRGRVSTSSGHLPADARASGGAAAQASGPPPTSAAGGTPLNRGPSRKILVQKTLPPRLTREWVQERVWFEPSCGCWLWGGEVRRTGYGAVAIWGPKKNRRFVWRRRLAAHRVSYELHVGPIPDGVELDHRCRNRGCVNPDHLQPLTHDEHVAVTVERRRRDPVSPGRRHQPPRFECRRGHPASERHMRPDGYTVCMPCYRLTKARGRSMGPISGSGSEGAS